LRIYGAPRARELNAGYNAMRLILLIVTLLGGVIFGYALMTDIYLRDDLTDVIQVLYPKGKEVLPSQISKNLTPILDKMTVQHSRNSFIISGIGGGIFIFGLVGLIIESKKKGRQNSA
jgi:hypothetical protein